MIEIFWLAMRLCASGIAPPTPEACGAHALLATRAATVAGVEPDLVLAIAAVESSFHADRISKTGRHCGVLQAMGRGARCRALLDLATGYAAGGEELRYWRRRCRGRVNCILAGHGAGNAWAENCKKYPRCPRYQRKVRRRIAALRRFE